MEAGCLQTDQDRSGGEEPGPGDSSVCNSAGEITYKIALDKFLGYLKMPSLRFAIGFLSSGITSMVDMYIGVSSERAWMISIVFK